MTHNLGTLGCGPGPYDEQPRRRRPVRDESDYPRPVPPLRRDYRIIGCALCRGHEEPMPYVLPPPWASLDARDDVRVHANCYRRLVWAVWAVLGFAEIPPGFLS